MKSLSQHSTPHQLTLRFFDVDVSIKTDSQTSLAHFGQMYHHFQIKSHAARDRSTVDCMVFMSADNPWGKPLLKIEEQIWPFTDSGQLVPYVFDGILMAILARIRSHYLIHAGVVSYQGRGVILVADSFHGKTTLVLELVRRGFQFLSDETAALGREDRRVHPFPRRFSIRPGTLDLTGLSNVATVSSLEPGRVMLDPESLRPGSIGTPATIEHIVFLQNPRQAQPAQSDALEQVLTMVVSTLDDNLLARVRQIDGVKSVSPVDTFGYPAFCLQAARPMFVLSQLETVCYQRGILMLGIGFDKTAKPCFDMPAYLEPMAGSQAVLALLHRFQGGHRSVLIQEEFDDNITGLYMDLADLIGQAQYHQLRLGPLNEMADLVAELVNVQ